MLGSGRASNHLVGILETPGSVSPLMTTSADSARRELPFPYLQSPVSGSRLQNLPVRLLLPEALAAGFRPFPPGGVPHGCSSDRGVDAIRNVTSVDNK
jgi:hypothetical protein